MAVKYWAPCRKWELQCETSSTSAFRTSHQWYHWQYQQKSLWKRGRAKIERPQSCFLGFRIQEKYRVKHVGETFWGICWWSVLPKIFLKSPSQSLVRASSSFAHCTIPAMWNMTAVNSWNVSKQRHLFPHNNALIHAKIAKVRLYN